MAQRAALSVEVKAALRPWYPNDVMDGVLVLRGSFFGWLFGLNGNHAVTINGAVHLTKRAPLEGSLGWTALMGHELFHVEQQAAIGWWPLPASVPVAVPAPAPAQRALASVRDSGVRARRGDTCGVGAG